MSNCPNAAYHTQPQPAGYLQWHEWASRMSRMGYRQYKCSGCGLYQIWKRVS